MVTFTGNSVGDTATYTCNSGFTLNGDAITECTEAEDSSSAEFQPAAPSCSEILCPDPVGIANGMVTFTGNSVGDTATYTCNSGFTLNGDAITECTEAEDSSSAEFQPAAPSCAELLCPNPVGIANGMVTFTGNSIGATATYTCDSGFELIGGATTTCIQENMNSAAFQPAPSCRHEYTK